MSGRGRLTDPATLLANLTGLPITGPLVSGQPIGSFIFQKLTFASANVDTTFTITLGRLPTVYLVARRSQAGSVYDGSNNGTDWNPGRIVLRASAIGSYWMLIA